MRLHLFGPAIAVTMLIGTSAHAGRLGGGGGGGHSSGGHSGGGGRLSHVSSGIRSGSQPSGGGSYGGHHGYGGYHGYGYGYGDYRIRRHYHPYYRYAMLVDTYPVDEVSDEKEPAAGTARLEGSFSMEKVYQSDGAISGELAIQDGWFRLSGGINYYFERQEAAPPLTMSVPSLKGGVRVADIPGTNVFIEGGVAWAITRNDQMGDSSIAGLLAGIHVDHALTPRLGLVADAHAYRFMNSDVRAASARAALRFSHVEAGFRVMTFNVAPALFGPEVGVHF